MIGKEHYAQIAGAPLELNPLDHSEEEKVVADLGLILAVVHLVPYYLYLLLHEKGDNTVGQVIEIDVEEADVMVLGGALGVGLNEVLGGVLVVLGEVLDANLDEALGVVRDEVLDEEVGGEAVADVTEVLAATAAADGVLIA